MNDPERETGTDPSAASGEDFATKINRLARLLAGEHYPPGDRAALKRYAPGQTAPLAFYRLWLRHLDSDLPSGSQTSSWATLTWGLAISGTGAHRPGRSLGQALAESGYAEARLERFLGTRDELSRLRLFSSLARFLAAKGEAFDWLDAARLLLTRDTDKREAVHRQIATAYYRHLPRSEKE